MAMVLHSGNRSVATRGGGSVTPYSNRYAGGWNMWQVAHDVVQSVIDKIAMNEMEDHLRAKTFQNPSMIHSRQNREYIGPVTRAKARGGVEWRGDDGDIKETDHSTNMPADWPKEPFSANIRASSSNSSRSVKTMSMKGSIYENVYRSKKIKPTKFNKNGVHIGDDAAAFLTSSRTLYFGHYTHPFRAVLTVIGHSIAKFLGKKCAGHVPSHLEEAFGGDTNLTLANVDVRIRYRTEPAEAATAVETAITSGPYTYLSLGIAIRDFIFAAHADTAAGSRIVFDEIIVSVNQASANNLTWNARRFKFADIKIKVAGLSILKFQNTTFSAGTGGSSDIHNINNNPVEGKEYTTKGSKIVVKKSQQGGVSPAATVSSTTGFGNFAWDVSADPEIDRIWEHPPESNLFWNKVTQRYVRMQPGTMNRSVITRTHYMPFNQWIRIYARSMRTGLIGTSDAVSTETTVGVSRWYAVDKLIHDGDDGTTDVSTEVHVELKAQVFYKQKHSRTAMYPGLT